MNQPDSKVKSNQIIIVLLVSFSLISMACGGFSTEWVTDTVEIVASAAAEVESSSTYTQDTFSCIPANTAEYATVVYIYDGDTIQVEMNGELYKVRFIGVDTPERETYYYEEATAATTALLPIGTEVMLVKDVSETDRYGRLLRYIVNDDVFINYQLVVEGFAYAKSYQPDTSCDSTLDEAERIAENNQVGLFEP